MNREPLLILLSIASKCYGRLKMDFSQLTDIYVYLLYNRGSRLIGFKIFFFFLKSDLFLILILSI